MKLCKQKRISLFFALSAIHISAMQIQNDQFRMNFMLWNGAREHNITKVKESLRFGANPNYQRVGFGTPLHALLTTFANSNSYQSYCKPILEELIEAGADLNIQDTDGRTALMIAASAAYSKPDDTHIIIKILLSYGVYADFKDRYGQDVFDMLSREGKQIDTIKELIEEEAINNDLIPMDTSD